MDGPDSEREVIERWNDVFRAIGAEPRRQIVLSLLAASDEGSEEATWVSLPEAANPSFAPRDPEQLRLKLLHTHLPMLADGDYVVWQRDPFRAARGPTFEEVAVVLGTLRANVDDVPAQLVRGYEQLERARRRGNARAKGYGDRE